MIFLGLVKLIVAVLLACPYLSQLGSTDLVRDPSLNQKITVLECDRQFKLKAQLEKKGDHARWRLLVKKVISAKTISSLSQQKRKRMEESRGTMGDYSIRSFKL